MSKSQVREETLKERESCWKRFRSIFRLTKENATPINWPVFFCCFIALFESCYSITYIFPFLPDQILYFGHKEEEKGYYSGLIASSLFGGRIFGSYFWGWLSDRKGRKPIIIICMVLVNFTNLGYGFVPSVPWAMTLRFVNGLCNGIVGTMKTVLYDVCDDTNQSVGMSVISMGWGSGIVLGPLISGYLAKPAVKYPGVFSETGIFGRFPYLLPSLFTFIKMALFTIPLVKLPETLKKNRDDESLTINVESKPVSTPERNGKPKSHVRFAHDVDDDVEDVPMTHTDDVSPSVEEEIMFIDSPAQDEYSRMYGLGAPVHSMDDLLSLGPHPRPAVPDLESDGHTRQTISNGTHSPKKVEEESQITSQKESTCSKLMKRWAILRLLSDYDIRMAIALYATLSFCAIGYDEIFTVWASTVTPLGGLGFQIDEIGSVIGYSSVPLLVINVFLFPFVESKIGVKKTFLIFGWFLVAVSPLKPTFRFLLGNKVALWVTLITVVGMHRICTTTVFSCGSLFVNNSVRPEDAGTVNGLAMTFSAILRTLAPTIGGAIYSWAIVHGVKIGWPFDVNAVFLLFGAFYLVSHIIGALMPEHLNKQKKKK